MIYAESGINLNADKKTMLEIRLKRRLRSLSMSSCRRVLQIRVRARHREDNELVHLIDAVTTNKTDFFREPDHFDYLAGQGAAGPGRRAMAPAGSC